MAKKLLLVDDEPLILRGLKFSLEQDGYQTVLAADGEEGRWPRSMRRTSI